MGECLVCPTSFGRIELVEGLEHPVSKGVLTCKPEPDSHATSWCGCLKGLVDEVTSDVVDGVAEESNHPSEGGALAFQPRGFIACKLSKPVGASEALGMAVGLCRQESCKGDGIIMVNLGVGGCIGRRKRTKPVSGGGKLLTGKRKQLPDLANTFGLQRMGKLNQLRGGKLKQLLHFMGGETKCISHIIGRLVEQLTQRCVGVESHQQLLLLTQPHQPHRSYFCPKALAFSSSAMISWNGGRFSSRSRIAPFTGASFNTVSIKSHTSGGVG